MYEELSLKAPVFSASGSTALMSKYAVAIRYCELYSVSVAPNEGL
jgi:hypothetical protein